MKDPDMTLPALLEQNAANNPTKAATSFHRYAYRSGCPHPSAKAEHHDDIHLSSETRWHTKYNARENHSESHRWVSISILYLWTRSVIRDSQPRKFTIVAGWSFI